MSSGIRAGNTCTPSENAFTTGSRACSSPAAASGLPWGEKIAQPSFSTIWIAGMPGGLIVLTPSCSWAGPMIPWSASRSLPRSFTGTKPRGTGTPAGPSAVTTTPAGRFTSRPARPLNCVPIMMNDSRKPSSVG